MTREIILNFRLKVNFTLSSFLSYIPIFYIEKSVALFYYLGYICSLDRSVYAVDIGWIVQEDSRHVFHDELLRFKDHLF